MKKFSFPPALLPIMWFAFVLAWLALCTSSCSHSTPLPTKKYDFNCKRVVKPLRGSAVFTTHLDTAFRIGDTVTIEYTHEETHKAVIIR